MPEIKSVEIFDDSVSIENRDGVAHRSYRLSFRVETDVQVRSHWLRANWHTALPTIGAALAWDSAARITKLDIKRTDDPRILNVVADASTQSITLDQSADDSPLARPARVKWGSQKTSVPYFIDADGEEVKNSSGEFFDSQPERDEDDTTVTITQNVAAFNISDILSHRNKVNSTAVSFSDGKQDYTIPIGAGRIIAIEPSELKTQNEIDYYELSITIDLRDPAEGGWDDTFLDVGFNELIAGELVEIVDKKGEAISSPAPLNGSGAKATGAAAELTFKPYKSLGYTIV